MSIKHSIAGTSIAVASASMAWAQEQPAPTPPEQAASAPETTQTQRSGDVVLQQVVISARRRLERAQDVPIAVTAFDQEGMRQLNIQSAADLQNFVPSLNVMGIGPELQAFTIRGLGMTGAAAGGGAGGGQGVVAYLAEAPSTASGPGVLFDLQSLQVLKGPQGTLFGRNTTGGAVIVEPIRPRFGDTDGYLELTGGNYKQREARFGFNLPVGSEKFSVRLAGMYAARDGYTKDAVTGVDYDNRDTQALRIGVLAKPFEGFENYLVAQAVRNNQHGIGNVLVAVNPDTPLGALLVPELAAQQARGIDSVSYGFTPVQKREALSVVDNARWQLSPGLAIKNVFSVSHTRGNGSLDGDASPLQISDLLGADPGGWSDTARTTTEELQLQGKSWDEQLNWQTGAYYEEVHTAEPQTYNSRFLFPGLGGGFTRQPYKNVPSRSKAIYAQGTLDLGAISEGMKGLNLTAGYRQTWDRVSFDGYLYGAFDAAPSQLLCIPVSAPYPDCAQTGTADSHGPSWTLSLDYHLSEATLVYAQATRGYKSGGFNQQVASTDPFFRYRPENVRNVEVGIKSVFKLGTMPTRVSFDVFDTDYNDVQRNVFALVDINGAQSAGQITANAASATIKGAELEAMISPIKPMQVGLTYSFLDAKYKRFVDPMGNVFTDSPFLYTPRHKLSLTSSYRVPIEGHGDLSLRAAVAYQSAVSVADDRQPYDTIAAYSLVNLRADWQGFYKNAWSDWDAALFVTNATNRRYRNATLATYNSSGYITTNYAEPRMVGVSVRASF